MINLHYYLIKTRVPLARASKQNSAKSDMRRLKRVTYPCPFASLTMPKKTTAEATNSATAQQQYMMHDGIDHYELPKAVITRIAKSAVRPA